MTDPTTPDEHVTEGPPSDPAAAVHERLTSCEVASDDEPHYDKADLLAMATSADAPPDVLRVLDGLAPQARFRYLAELWDQGPEDRGR